MNHQGALIVNAAAEACDPTLSGSDAYEVCTQKAAVVPFGSQSEGVGLQHLITPGHLLQYGKQHVAQWIPRPTPIVKRCRSLADFIRRR